MGCKFGVLYRDPHLHLERFESVGKAQSRYNELAKTAVENLMFIIIVDEKVEVIQWKE